MKLFVKFSKMCRSVKTAELNIIKRLEKLNIDPSVLDDVVDVVCSELDDIVKK